MDQNTCLESKELFTWFNMSLEFTFYRLYHFDSIFIKHIEHIPNPQTFETKTYVKEQN